MKTFWFDLLFLEPPLDATPGLLMHVLVKNIQAPSYTGTPEDQRGLHTIGHQALRASELEQYVLELKNELDHVVAEAKRRDEAYHKKLRVAGS